MSPRGWMGKTSADGTPLVRKHRPDHKIALYAGILMLLGLVLIYAIGPQRANVLNSLYGYEYSESYFFVKQLFSIGLAMVGFSLFAFLPYKYLMKYATALLIIGIVASAILAVAGWLDLPIAQTANGATRWFNLGSLGTLQPAEVLKFGVLVYLSVFVGKRAKEGSVNDWNSTLLPVIIVTLIAVFFIVFIQRDLGTGISLMAIVGSIMFIAGLKWKYVGIATLALLAGLVLMIIVAPHRMERVMTFLQGDNTSTSDDSSYHIQQAKIALGSGGFWGLGIGESVQSSGYLPEAINDSIFAVFGETFGFVGVVALIVLFMALLRRLIELIDRLVDRRLKFLAAGIFGWFGSHVILNIGAMIGIFPLTGITLPLLSYGGTSMVFMASILGLAYQLSRYTTHSIPTKEAIDEDSSSRRRVGRSRYASNSGF